MTSNNVAFKDASQLTLDLVADLLPKQTNNSQVSTVTRLRPDAREFPPWADLFSSLQRPGQLWGLNSLPFNECRELFH
jgi:hypothetical protein